MPPSRDYGRQYAVLVMILFLLVPYLGLLSRYSEHDARIHNMVRKQIVETLNLQNNSTAPLNKPSGSNSQNKTIVVVVRLQGELGNNLCKIGYGKSLQFLLRDRYGIFNTRLALRPQRDSRKGKFARKLLGQCFDWTRTINFSETYSSPLSEKIKEAKLLKWSALHFNNQIAHNPKNLLKQLDEAVQIWRTNQSAPKLLWADGYLNPPNNFLLHHYRQELVESTFALSHECCAATKEMPYDDEIVFHLRSFLHEILPHKAQHLHWHEASPKTMSTKMLKNLNKGDRISLVGPPTANRFKALAAQGHKHAMLQHEKELQSLGFRTRIISSDNTLDDFCFLVNTKKLLIGAQQSTFVTWASYLGNANKTLLYAIGDRDTEHIHSWADTPLDYQPDPLLQKRYHQRVFQQLEG